MPVTLRRSTRVALICIFTGWLSICAAISAYAIRYDYLHRKPTEQSQNPANKTLLPINANGAMIMLAVHPQCSCTPASITQLGRIKDRINNPNDRYVMLVYQPMGSKDARWIPDSLLKLAEEYHLVIFPDVEGLIASSVGIETSGHVLAISKSGKLIFSGGITANRGHAGDNFYSDTLTLAIQESHIEHQDSGETKNSIPAPVFGCSIVELGEKQ